MVQEKPSYASLFSGSASQPKPPIVHPPRPPISVPRPQQATQPPPPNPSYVPKPDHVPNTTYADERLYVLTFLTDASHHNTMTQVRTRYFPPHLNRLSAHLTLFHALPGSRLSSSIEPTLTSLCESVAPFPIAAATPFRLRQGIAVGVPKGRGGDQARDVHALLKREWQGFLSEQDRGGFRAHYTVMNKVDDEDLVGRAFREVEGSWRDCEGVAEGLSLFLYNRGRWRHIRDWRFVGGAGEM